MGGESKPSPPASPPFRKNVLLEGQGPVVSGAADPLLARQEKVLLPHPGHLCGVSASLPRAPPLFSRRVKLPAVPPPDSTEGRALIVGLLAGVFYAFLLVGANTPLSNFDWAWIPLVLILATIVSFNLGARLDADHARVRLLELELARTVAVHSGSGQLPEAGSALGRVLSEYARSADVTRQRARAHAYAAGPAIWGAGGALLAALLWGLSYTTSTVWVNYLAIVVELPVFVFLFYAVGALALNVGGQREVVGFAALTPQRWRRYGERNAALDATISVLPWLAERPSASADSRSSNPSPSSSTKVWSEQSTS